MDWLTFLNVLDSAVRLSAPLLLACLAGLFTERAGVVDIGLEGKMLAGAFAAGATAVLLPQGLGFGGVNLPPLWTALLAAIGAAVVFGLIHAFACVTQRGDQIVSGVALNFIALGLAAVLGHSWFGQGGKTPPPLESARFTPIELPYAAEAAASWGPLGRFYAEVISGHNLLVYFAFLAPFLAWWILARTRFGLRLRAVGENPAAVDTAGVSVARLRYAGQIICGLLCGVAGAYLSIGLNAGYISNMTAGRGYIALAALIFAKWRPVPALFACLLFGFLDAAANRLQGAPLPGVGVVPVQFIQALPYVLTVILLAGFIGRAIPPKAGGVPYVKER